MKRSKPQWPLFLCSALFGATNAFAAIDISQAPLETGTTVDPNIMFIFDDSGSMLLGLIPEDEIKNATVGSCSTSPYAGLNTCFLDVGTNRAFLASSYVNKIYFDPMVEYPVPKRPDGTSLGNANFTAAWVNGYDIASRGSNTIDLSKNYRAIISGGSVASWSYANFSITPYNTVTTKPAFYYQYDASNTGCSSKYSNACYDLKTLSSDEEKQNFANWFSYYRTRMLAAKGGISEAFHAQGASLRVGFGTINTIKSSTRSPLFSTSDTELINRSVLKFEGTARTKFFEWLFKIQPDSVNFYTPLRTALDKVGQYYETDAPWKSTPASSTMLECRQSFSILMTDGYYRNDSAISVGDQDSSDGLSLTSSKGTNYQFKANTSPFTDGRSNTLADVAMKYWKKDLRTDLGNSVPTSKQNPAFWQHMVTFGVAFGVIGTINREDAINAILSKATITWPDPKASGTDSIPEKIDDLLHAAVNSRGDFFSANDPKTFAKGLAQTLNNIAERVGSASNIAATSINSLQTESNLYQARYVAGEWSGDLVSYKAGNATTPVWKASDNMPKPEDRKIYYGSLSGPEVFLWDKLSSDEKKWLGNDSTVLDYIRGEQKLEKKNTGGKYRNRVKILGDIVNSSPELVAEPQDLNYQRLNIPGATSYREFLNGPAKTRTPMIYVGGNDGMLHGFDANTGVEKFAYIPKNVMKPGGADTVNVLNKYAQPEYLHQFSVDGSPVAVDVFIDGEWKTILVGGLGRGSAKDSGSSSTVGGGFYAIDVTSPGTLDKTKIRWDKSFPEAGTFLGEPQVTRMNSGEWALVLGYGLNNSTNQSGILVIDLADGDVIRNIPTIGGTAIDPNAMSELSLLDVNADGMTDWIYGGDLHGKVWKFNVSNTSASLWGLEYGAPLFTAKDSANNRQKITGGVLSVMDPKTGKVWLFFGTGQYLNQDDPSNAAIQSWYGIQDGAVIPGRTSLEPRVITNVGSARTVSDGVTITDTKRGWYMDLPSTRERIVDMPIMVGTELLMNTVIPDTNVCNPTGSGYLMAISPFNGQRLKKPFFDLNGDNKFNDSDKVTSGSTLAVPVGVLVSSLNSVMTIVKEKDPDSGEDIIKTYNNCEDACIEGRAIDPTRNNGMQSWREITQ